MKLTLLEVGEVPAALKSRFISYPQMYQRMFDEVGADIAIDVVPVLEGAPMPAPETREAVLVPGSAAGVYDDNDWMAPLRDFIRRAYAADIPMVGVCFGHQAIADALGGDVRKSEKGWGVGRHVYDVAQRPGFMGEAGTSIAIACSHQDQVITLPENATVVMASEFTPNAGLIYGNGKTFSMQPHPEFHDDYSEALITSRIDKLSPKVAEAGLASLKIPSQHKQMARYIARFLESARAA